MGERTHTPGPWLAVGGILQNDEEGNPRFYIRPEASDGWQVAQTFGPNGEANARLIAAAPDMFAALQAVVDSAVLIAAGEEAVSPAAMKAVREALAKASPHV